MMEAQAHPLIMAIPRFIQLSIPLPPLEQVKIAWLMLEIDCPAHQHGQKTYSVAI
jgi:hypothetical protein